MRPREEIKKALETALAREFSSDSVVSVEDGWRQNIHVKVVSKRFDAMSDQDAADCLWNQIEKAGLVDDEKGLISLALAIGMRDL